MKPVWVGNRMICPPLCPHCRGPMIIYDDGLLCQKPCEQAAVVCGDRVGATLAELRKAFPKLVSKRPRAGAFPVQAERAGQTP